MANVHPPELQVEDFRFGQAYVPTDPDWQLPYDEWVPTLESITDVSTFGEQHARIRDVLVAIAAPERRLMGASPQKARFTSRSYDLEARFRASDDNALRMGYVSVHLGEAISASIAYQTPDDTCRNPAFAVVESRTGQRVGWHEVISSQDEELTHLSKVIGKQTVKALANHLHGYYPGFGLLEKLGIKDED